MLATLIIAFVLLVVFLALLKFEQCVVECEDEGVVDRSGQGR